MPYSSFLSSDKLAISDSIPPIQKFNEIDNILASFRQPDFLSLSPRQRFKHVNHTLCELIRQAPREAFLFSALIDFFHCINQESILEIPLDFSAFEFWLNHSSTLTESENYEIRAKIVGKHLPRGDYQAFFPVGMGKVYPGSHFIAAHLSPDIDTMIASFWGWMDAFGARVSLGLHFWCLPGGPPDSPVTNIFRHMLGDSLFLHLARTSSSLTLTARDLIDQQSFIKAFGHTIVNSIDHQSEAQAIIVVDKQGHYLGEWHNTDAELTRQIIILFKSCLRWFENNLHAQLITLFSKETLTIQELPNCYASIFDVTLINCAPVQDLGELHCSHLHHFFQRVLGIAKGLQGTFRDLHHALADLSIPYLLAFQEAIEALPSSDLFDIQGRLKEERPLLFERLKVLIKQLDNAMFHVRNYVERLDILLSIKHKVLGLPYVYLTLQSDVDEMQQKMQHRDFLPVVTTDQNDSLIPVGVIHAQDLYRNGLGTVTLRDFCNSEEIHMAPYLNVISVIDHHKSSLKTSSAPTALIGDVQSCNVLLAEQAFALNDRYSLGGLQLSDIDKHIQNLSNEPISPSNIRIWQRLLNRRLASLQRGLFYIHPEREFKEYLCFLHAILDDTDLLTKVTYRDIACIVELLNRLKSLLVHQEVEVIHLDDLPRNEHFVKKAVQRILKQHDMHVLYQQIYSLRESAVETNLNKCIEGHNSNIFLDTKEQNSCARVGQTKMFASNFPYFTKHACPLRHIWFKQSKETYERKPELDFHLHMISTIASADEVYHNHIGPYKHQDEWWFWIPGTQKSYNHLNRFLAAIQPFLAKIKEDMWLELVGSTSEELAKAFTQELPWIPIKNSKAEISSPMAILHFKAGTLNSRKSMVTPYLPHINYHKEER